MSTVVAAPFPSPNNHNHRSYHNMTSPTQPSKQRSNNSKPPRVRDNAVHNNHQHAQSDSGLPSQAQTPRTKKTRPRPSDNRTASGSDIPKVNRAKTVPFTDRSPMATPAKPAAYAGPTFHASPAASTLPMPKFASKSVPMATSANSLQAKLEAESTKNTVSSPVPEPAIPAHLGREKSPLDIFFNADRQERKSSSPLVQRRTSPPEAKNMFAMDMENANSPLASRSPAPRPQSNGLQPNKEEADRQAYTQSLKDFLKLPSNQSPVTQAPPPAQAQFSTPQQQRILEADPSLHYGNRNLSPMFQAARSSPSASYNTPPRNSSSQSNQPFDPRAYLNSHISQQQSSPFASVRQPDAFPSPQPPMQPHYHAQPHPHELSGVPRQQPPYAQPTYAQQPDLNNAPDVKDMEAKLRGMLKLC